METGTRSFAGGPGALDVHRSRPIAVPIDGTVLPGRTILPKELQSRTQLILLPDRGTRSGGEARMMAGGTFERPDRFVVAFLIPVLRGGHVAPAADIAGETLASETCSTTPTPARR